ncbi:DUF935 domain-containing protein [Palleronia caenipelagi]|uniref:DUF935 domain-containing protein n=1 Tax=Palleronia caenipelagi TaxID=2489174 RepID=A0A547PW81_9RHOB|nr:DUF935 domain-containing protein [Palleronia caenipelagi]TRD18385.1 DUF935 domain-containing protein [Palleronia caenipelagi]
MAVLDPYGRPVKLARLTEEQAAPSLTGIRSAFAEAVALGLTPVKLAGILQACDQGDLGAFVQLAEEMEERDPHYFSVLGTRKRAVSGVAPRVVPAGESAKEKAIAEAVTEQIAEAEGFSELIEDLLDCLGKGFALVEIDWHRDRSRWWPAGFVRVDPRFVTYDRETGREMRLIDEEDMVGGVPLTPFKFIRMDAQLKSGLAFRGGLARVVAFSWMCKAYTLKDWMAFVETYGLPLRLGRYGPSATPEDRKVLLRAVANIGSDAAAILPDDMRIEFTESKGTTGDKVFENLGRYVDEQISKAVLGQTMTSDDGSSMAQAEVHNEVRHDIAQADARAVTAALNRDLVRPFVDLNFGVQATYPKLLIEIAEAEDTDMVLQNVARLAALGVRFRQSEVRAKLGFSDPDADDEVFGGPVAKARPQTTEPATKDALNQPGTAPWWEELDAIERQEAEDWQGVMDPLTDPIDAVILGSTSFEEAIARLGEVLPQMRSAPLIDRLVRAMVQARGLGDVRDG